MCVQNYGFTAGLPQNRRNNLWSYWKKVKAWKILRTIFLFAGKDIIFQFCEYVKKTKTFLL